MNRKSALTRLAILISGLGALFLPLVALAHAGLISAHPLPGSTVPGPVTTIRAQFDERLEPDSTFTLTTGLFQNVVGVNPILEGDTLRVGLATPLPPGRYTVQWRAVTEDGSTTGSYQFGVGPPIGAVGGGRALVWAGGIIALIGLAALGGFIYWRRR